MKQELYLTVKKDGHVFGNLDKMPVIIDTARNIGTQAEEIISNYLDFFGFQQETRENIAWKIFQYKNNKYMWVTKTENWVDG